VNEVLETLTLLTHMTLEDAIRFTAEFIDELLSVEPKSIAERLQVFLGHGIVSDSRMAELVHRCPQVLFAVEPKKMVENLAAIQEFFPSGDLTTILRASPELLLRPWQDLELRYDYIHFHMCIEPSAFIDCAQWANMELEEIMMRHEFMLKCGVYFTPDPKRPQYAKMNPSIWHIFDSDDMTFAHEICHCTLPEWHMFRDLFIKLKEEDAEHKKDDGDDSENLPYEKVKPAHRKAFERRVKQRRRFIEGELEC